MYKISRLLLISAIGLCAYTYFMIFSSAGLWIAALLAILYLKNHGKSLWSHGTAKWANADDLRYALDAREGLTLGRMHVKRSFLSLFNPRIPSREACKGVFGYNALIRLPTIHTLVCAPTGAGMSNGLQETNKVHILVDEASALGKMEALEDAVNVGRGYGMRISLIYQSLGQLKACWPNGNDQTALASCTQVFFGVNDNITAEYISNRLGEHTIIVNSGGTSTSHSRQASYGNSTGSTSYSVSSNENWSAQGRRLLKPEEIMAWDQREAITLHAGMPPIHTRLVRYYERDFRDGWFKRAFTELTIVLTSLAIFLTAAVAAVKVRHDKEVQRARLDAAIVPGSQGSVPGNRAGTKEARRTRMH